MKTQLTAVELEALRNFAKENGRLWKSKLWAAWMTASAEPTLQRLRNVAHFGPAGLVNFKVN